MVKKRASKEADLMRKVGTKLLERANELLDDKTVDKAMENAHQACHLTQAATELFLNAKQV